MSVSSDSDLDTWTLPTEFYHRDHTDIPKTVYENAQRLQDPSLWASLVVQLDFIRDGPRHGTGFYLDVPNATYKGSGVDVILTAAHNLMGENGVRSRELKVVSQDTPEGWLVKDDLVKICREYEKRPHEGEPYYDWGVILQQPPRERKDTKAPRGFQFNLAFAVHPAYGEKNALHEFMASHICVTGYGGPQVENKVEDKSEDKSKDKPENKLGRFVVSSGKGKPRSGCLEYRVPTQQGMSGSPVWATCDGNATAVGIHTSGPEEWGEPGVSKGVWLRLSVIENILGMVGGMRLAKRLQYQDPKQPWDEEGPYLHFRSPQDPAVVRLGVDSLTTTFDVFPTGGRHGGHAAYAFRVRQPPEWRVWGGEYHDDSLWVIWDVDRDRATLSSTLHNWSAVAFWEKSPARKKRRPGGKKKTVSEKGDASEGINMPPLFTLLTFGTDSRMNRQLAMGSKYIRREDLCYGPVESSEVSFKYCAGSREHFFCLAG